MRLEDMIERVRNRTYKNDVRKILSELNSAMDWAWNRVYTMNKDLLITYKTELTLSTRTQDYDLGTNVTGTLYGIKSLSVRFNNETFFTPAIPKDSTDSVFAAGDIYQSDSTETASNHPVFYTIRNFDQVRFSPPLPADTELAVDFLRKPPDFSLDSNAVLDAGNDIPEPTHEAIVDKATAQMYINIDDDRVGYWESQAERKLVSAMNVLRDRQFQTPMRTKPFRRHIRRLL